MSDSITCPNCATSNPPRTIQCQSCGHDLPSGESLTRFVGNIGDLLNEVDDAEGRVFFPRNAGLNLIVVDSDEVLQCDLSQNTFTLGRTLKNPTADSPPHLDLSDYGAKDNGVSRQHARITRVHATVMLEDLGALNGTTINGERISPVEPRALADGDRIGLGSLALKVKFEL